MGEESERERVGGGTWEGGEIERGGGGERSSGEGDVFFSSWGGGGLVSIGAGWGDVVIVDKG